MRITVLLRFPKVERADWKRAIVDGLLDRGHEVALVFGESSYFRHARAALKTYGFDAFQSSDPKRSDPSGPKLAGYFKERGVSVYRVGDLNGTAAQNRVRELKTDLLLLLGTGIIREPILDIPQVGTLHCHQGDLPAYRGVNTIEWSILNGDSVCITTHYVNAGIDTGEILLTRRISLMADDTIASIRRKCHEEAVPLLLETVDQIADGSIQPRPQSAADGMQYFSMHPLFLETVERTIPKRAGLQ